MPASRWKDFRDSLGHLAALVALIGGCVVVGGEVWPRIDRWHQQRLARQLAERIAALPDDEVKLPLHQLASIGTPALSELVRAAASQRDAVARVAQDEIDIAFSACLMQMREGVGETQIETLTVLAAALTDHVGAFGPTGQRWAERLTLRIVEVSNQLPAEPAATLLAATGRVLDGIPPRRPLVGSVEAFSSEQAAAVESPPLDVAMLAEPSERVLSAPGLPDPAAQPLSMARDRAPSEDQSPDAIGESWNPEWIGVRTVSPPPPLAGDASLSVEVRDKEPPVPVDVPTPLEFKRRLTDLRRLSTDELIEQLGKADKFAAGAIRAVLIERGIDAAEVDTAQRIKSADEAGRLRLVDEVSQLPAAAARRMLRLLLHDASGEVRLRALTALATTNDPELPDLVRAIAIEDKDPRVADLATKLMRQ